jgi:hypothetical protein
MQQATRTQVHANVPSQLLRAAKIAAAERGTTIGALVLEGLQLVLKPDSSEHVNIAGADSVQTAAADRVVDWVTELAPEPGQAGIGLPWEPAKRGNKCVEPLTTDPAPEARA